jgi:general secretion pathway protein N
MKRQVFWVLTGISSFAISLAVLAPLPFFAQQITKYRPELTFAGVKGSLWKGEIARLNTPKAEITDLTWKFAPAKLFSGVLAADMEGKVQTMQVKGICGLAWNTDVNCSPLNLELPANSLAKLSPALQNLPVTLGGTFRAIVDDVSWDRQGIPSMNGSVIWAEGSMQTPVVVNLGGQYRARVKQGKDNQALNIALQSDQAMVVLDGKVDLEKDGQYQAEFFLKPSAEADPTIAQGLSLLGAPQTDGSIRIKQSGQVSLQSIEMLAATPQPQAVPAPAPAPAPAEPIQQPVAPAPAQPAGGEED